MNADTKTQLPDFTTMDAGSLIMIYPQNIEARQHLKENVSDEAQWFGGALAVEPRYYADFRAAVEENGYTII